MSEKLKPGECTVGDHFVGKTPALREVYDRVIAALRRIGRVRQEPKKTSIHLVRSSRWPESRSERTTFS